MEFVAIDFETATHDPTSACAVGLAVVRNGRIVTRRAGLFRPPGPEFVFTDTHGITFEDVQDKPDFSALWPSIFKEIGHMPLAAHNAAFDMRVLCATLQHYDLPVPDMPCICTLRLSKKVWPALRSHTLDTVAAHLGLPLNHHEAISDATVCAQIALLALKRTGCRTVLDMTRKLGLRSDYAARSVSLLQRQQAQRKQSGAAVEDAAYASAKIKTMPYQEDEARIQQTTHQLAGQLRDLRKRYGLYR